VNLATAVKSLSFLTGFAKRFATLTPFGALLSPMLGAAADLIADAVRAFFAGLAVVFKNPTVLIVVFVAMGYGYFNGHGAVSAKLAQANAEIVRLAKIKKCAAKPVASTPSVFDWLK